MSVIAFIPARGGSKSIPGKNIKDFCGKPLIYWNLFALEKSELIDEVIVASDSEKIFKKVEEFNFSKVKLYKRSAENAQDHSTSEAIMLEYINYAKLAPTDTFMLVQATSPFTRTEDFNNGLKLMNKYDTVFACAKIKRFIWNKDGIPLNYDHNNRPRRQDFDGTFMENGAFCISSVSDIIYHNNRISGNIGICEMEEYTFVEIDEVEDWIMAEQLFLKNNAPEYKSNFNKIKLLLSDVDGVLTDAGMYYTENGDEFKKFCTYDGMGFQLLQKTGIKVGILTTEDRSLNKRRANKLGLDFDFHGAKDKLKTVKDLCIKENITIDEVAYIGDDINCFSLLSNVGIAACPNNAMDKIKAIPNIIQLNKNGGDGVVREFAELILK
ncbi:MAG: acylneuraminate cytidylyltransferase [Flavobacteriales bacterium]|jgi:YrbI family 3-deoxy-D-manno-octulosonate 8-phosphate phosphatase|nr:acylneuraminate cytidylyltransferase [Flavobacteriales bacterium]